MNFLGCSVETLRMELSEVGVGCIPHKRTGIESEDGLFKDPRAIVSREVGSRDAKTPPFSPSIVLVLALFCFLTLLPPLCQAEQLGTCVCSAGEGARECIPTYYLCFFSDKLDFEMPTGKCKKTITLSNRGRPRISCDVELAEYTDLSCDGLQANSKEECARHFRTIWVPTCELDQPTGECITTRKDPVKLPCNVTFEQGGFDGIEPIAGEPSCESYANRDACLAGTCRHKLIKHEAVEGKTCEKVVTQDAPCRWMEFKVAPEAPSAPQDEEAVVESPSRVNEPE